MQIVISAACALLGNVKVMLETCYLTFSSSCTLPSTIIYQYLCY